MIKPGEIPQIPGNMDHLSQHASSLRKAAKAFADTGSDVHGRWQSLEPIYIAPESEQLLQATAPVKHVSGNIGRDFETAADALVAYVDDVKPIQKRLHQLKAQAGELVADIKREEDSEHLSDYEVQQPVRDWTDDDRLVARNHHLINEVNQAVAEWMAVQRRCANTINDLHGGPHYTADNGNAHLASNEFGLTTGQLNAAATGNGLPWGHAAAAADPVADVKDFFLGAKDGAVEFAKSVPALIGYQNGSWSGSTAWKAWKGLDSLATIITNPALVALNMAVATPLHKRGEIARTGVNAGKGIIAYDQWDKGHNGRAAGKAAFNLVSMLGTDGAGAGLRAAGAGVKGARTAGMAAKTGGGMMRAGEFLQKLPTASGLAIKAASKLHLHIPHLGDLLSFGNHAESGHHHVDTQTPSTRGPDAAQPHSGAEASPHDSSANDRPDVAHSRGHRDVSEDSNSPDTQSAADREETSSRHHTVIGQELAGHRHVASDGLDRLRHHGLDPDAVDLRHGRGSVDDVPARTRENEPVHVGAHHGTHSPGFGADHHAPTGGEMSSNSGRTPHENSTGPSGNPAHGESPSNSHPDPDNHPGSDESRYRPNTGDASGGNTPRNGESVHPPHDLSSGGVQSDASSARPHKPVHERSLPIQALDGKTRWVSGKDTDLIEVECGGNLDQALKEAGVRNKYPYFDIWDPETGTMTSIKSIDYRYDTYKVQPGAIYSTGLRYVDNITEFRDKFDVRQWESTDYANAPDHLKLGPKDVDRYELKLAYPVSAYGKHLEEYQRIGKYAEEQGVKLILQPIG